MTTATTTAMTAAMSAIGPGPGNPPPSTPQHGQISDPAQDTAQPGQPTPAGDSWTRRHLHALRARHPRWGILSAPDHGWHAVRGSHTLHAPDLCALEQQIIHHDVQHCLESADHAS